jgi:hypothetical protein
MEPILRSAQTPAVPAAFLSNTTLAPDGDYRASKRPRRVFGLRLSHKTPLRQPCNSFDFPRSRVPTAWFATSQRCPFANLRGCEYSS